MNISVIGAGGVGGYLAAMISQWDPAAEVVARGNRGRSIAEQGLVLHSCKDGEIVAHPHVCAGIRDLKNTDMIFICVKNYSLEEVCEELKAVVNENTILIPVMNGVEAGDILRAEFPMCRVVDSAIYIIAYAGEDYSVTQKQDFAYLRIGSPDRNLSAEAAAHESKGSARAEAALRGEAEAVQQVYDVLAAAGVDAKISDNIRLDLWRKYIINCAYNTSTARHRCAIGFLRHDKKLAQEYEALLAEAVSVGYAEGIPLEQSDIDLVLYKFYEQLAPDSTSSMQRDVMQGKPAEIETFCGYIVRAAARYGLPVPMTEAYYKALKDEN